MNNMIKIPDELLKELDVVFKKSGVTEKDFVNCVADFYNIKFASNENVIDSSYYDSFTA